MADKFVIVKDFNKLTLAQQKDVVAGFLSLQLKEERTKEKFEEVLERCKRSSKWIRIMLAKHSPKNSGRILGAMHFGEQGEFLYVLSVWAKPAKEYFRQTGRTVGETLGNLALDRAKKKCLKISVTSLTPTGKKFLDRVGFLKIPKKLRSRIIHI